MSYTDKITSDKILSLLRKKHEQDIFVSECKTGASGNGLRILDAWAMKRSWSPTQTIGYEIKVSRSDFLNDTKWEEYLKYCNSFYFVCPRGLISIDELPENVGLMYIASTGTRLVTKRKAVRREIEIPNKIFMYILMWRADIVHSTWNPRSRGIGREFWEKWLEKKRIDREFGRSVSIEIQRTIREKVDKVNQDNEELRRENKALQEIKDFLIENGYLNESGFVGYGAIRRIKEELMQPVKKVLDGFNKLKAGLESQISQVERLQEKQNENEPKKK